MTICPLTDSGRREAIRELALLGRHILEKYGWTFLFRPDECRALSGEKILYETANDLEGETEGWRDHARGLALYWLWVSREPGFRSSVSAAKEACRKECERRIYDDILCLGDEARTWDFEDLFGCIESCCPPLLKACSRSVALKSIGWKPARLTLGGRLRRRRGRPLHGDRVIVAPTLLAIVLARTRGVPRSIVSNELEISYRRLRTLEGPGYLDIRKHRSQLLRPASETSLSLEAYKTVVHIFKQGVENFRLQRNRSAG